MKLAAIDIGSNAARLIIKEVSLTPGNPKPMLTKLNMLRIPLRLGMDVFAEAKIGPARQAMFLQAMQIFRQLIDLYQVDHFRACATSAMRDASNGAQISALIKAQTGIDIQIISGDEEANLVYDNHVEEDLDISKNYLYIDVGGGSTELSLFENNQLSYKKSFNIGSLRILNQLITEDDWQAMKQTIKQELKGVKNLVAIGSGGNINKVFSMSKTPDNEALDRDYLNDKLKALAAMTVEERMRQYKIRQDRADVIVPALQIYTKVLKWADVDEIFVPKISIADGIIRQLYQQYGGCAGPNVSL
jgi:exopolyphosphatase / guanosine-5'-triphosphate,3'-diphosphate pyrophosphatase